MSARTESVIPPEVREQVNGIFDSFGLDEGLLFGAICAVIAAKDTALSEMQERLATAYRVKTECNDTANEERRLRLAAEYALAEMQAELERERAANSTRPDYDLRCEECGRAHILDTVIPSETWNQIAEPHNILCTLCIDKRLLAKGLSAEAEFYFVGGALVSRLYASQDEGEER